MVNLEIRKFKESLIAITNASPLPIEVKRMAFGEVQLEINDAANRVVLAERQESEKKETAKQSEEEQEEKEDA